MSDKFKTDMTTEEFIEYIRRCPKQFITELPDKMEKYIAERKIVDVLKTIHKTPITWIPDTMTDETKLRMDYAMRIIERHAPSAATNAEHLVDYALECTDQLMDRIKKGI